jgi:hypothetical protein
MSIWIRVICKRSTGPLNQLDLREGTRDADFAMWGEDYDLDDDEVDKIEEGLHFEVAATDVTLMHYRINEPDRFIRIERWTGMKAKEEVGELLEQIEDIESPAAERVRSMLRDVLETIAFELKLSDVESIGYSIAWATAMWLAERGAGLVQTESPDQWWDPDTYEVLLEQA